MHNNKLSEELYMKTKQKKKKYLLNDEIKYK